MTLLRAPHADPTLLDLVGRAVVEPDASTDDARGFEGARAGVLALDGFDGAAVGGPALDYMHEDDALLLEARRGGAPFAAGKATDEWEQRQSNQQTFHTRKLPLERVGCKAVSPAILRAPEPQPAKKKRAKATP